MKLGQIFNSANKSPKRKLDIKKAKSMFSGLKKGALHAQLGVMPGQKIPLSKITEAADSDNPLLKKRAQFALNARKFNK